MTLAASTAWNLGVELMWVGLLPLVAAAAAMVLAKRLGLLPRAAWAASAAVGVVVGQLGLAVRHDAVSAFGALVAPREAHHWLTWAAVLAAGVAIWWDHAPQNWRRLAPCLAALLTVAAPARMLGGSVYLTGQWSADEKVAYLALLAATIGLVWSLLATAEDENLPLVRGLLLVFAAVGTAAATTLAGSLIYGEMCGVTAAALTGALLAAAVCQVNTGLSGAGGVVTFSLGSLILLSYFYAELAASNAVLLLVAVVAAGGWLPPWVSRGPGWRGVVRATLCLVPLVAAVARCLSATLTSASPY